MSASASRMHILLAADRGLIEDCLAQVMRGDQLLLLDSGVEALAMNVIPPAWFETGRVQVSGPDLSARGLSAPTGVSCLDDNALAAWVLQFAQVLSWA